MSETGWLEIGVVVALGLAVADGILIAMLARTPETDPASGTRRGLPLGSALPSFATTAVDGTSVSEQHARGRLLLFLGAECHSCHPLVQQLATASPHELSRLLIVVVDRPTDPNENLLERLAFMPPGAVVHDAAREIADRVAMPGTPFVYAVDTQGRIRAKHGVSSLELLWSLTRFTGG